MHAPRAVEEDPHVRRHRLVAAEQVLEHRSADAVRMRALRDLGELRRIAEQDQVARGGAHGEGVGEAHLPGLVDDERVDEGAAVWAGVWAAAVEIVAGEQPRRAGHEIRARRGRHELVGVVNVSDPVGCVLRLGAAGARFLQATDPYTLLARRPADLVEQVVDGLVARGRDADFLVTADEVHDDARTRPRLAGARRALDEQIARVKRGGPLALLFQGGRLDRPAWRWAQPRPRPREDVFERPVPTVAGQDRGAEAGERVALRVGLDRPGGDQRLRK